MRPSGLTIGDALFTWHRPQIEAAGVPLASYDWRKNSATDPIYPPDPVHQCPRIVAKLHTEDTVPKVGHEIAYDFAISLYYYRIQVPGQNHQRILIDATELIKESLLANLRPAPVIAAGADILYVPQSVYHPELRHPRIDDPARRVSVAEILILAKVE